MSILNLVNASFNIGEQVLLDQVNLIVERGQKVCLVGRNGAGKSTLLKLLGGELDLDGGQIISQSGLRIARLEQDLPGQTELDVYSVIASAFGDLGQSLSEFRQLSQQADVDLSRLSEVQIDIEQHDGWTALQKIESIISKLDLAPDAQLSSLSGGWRRRVLLAKALVIEPELLLLDEPTNHLDIAAIEWLEDLLEQFPEALIMVSHDRALLAKVGTHFLTLDRGNLVPFAGRYNDYLAAETKRLAEEEQDNALADKKLAQEETWIRQGIKARRTRNEGRVRRLETLREQHKARRHRQGEAKLVIDQGVQAGKRVFESENLHLKRGAKTLIDNLDLVIQRGDRIGLVGPNGIGKSSFMQLFSGGLEPTSGTLKLGTKLSLAYFDQQRQQLDLSISALDNVAGGRDFIDIKGKSIHAISYLSDFMFSGTRARTKVEKLSGGERNRLLLAKLFSHPSNLLLLDEPTNDLDVETLEMLESKLIDFEGTVITASHDRSFLDNVTTSLLLFEGDGQITEHVGTYDEWLSYQKTRKSQGSNKVSTVKSTAKPSDTHKKPAKKLSYQLQRELSELPEKIATLEKQVEDLQLLISQPEFYQQAKETVSEQTALLATMQAQLDQHYARWSELEE